MCVKLGSNAISKLKIILEKCEKNVKNFAFSKFSSTFAVPFEKRTSHWDTD